MRDPLATRPIMAVRSADPVLLGHVRAVVSWFDADLVVRPPGAPPPPADIHLDAADERSSGDPPWVSRTGGLAVGLTDRPGVIGVPASPERLADAITGALAARAGRRIGVVGARGGAGASVLAALVARQVAALGRSTALVDLAGGLDVLLSIEDEPGPRWADLAPSDGPYPAAGLLGVLPRWAHAAVLASDARGLPSAQLAHEVVATISDAVRVVVCDLGRGRGVIPECDTIVVVTTAEPTSVVGVAEVRERLERAETLAAPQVVLAVRAGPGDAIGPDDLARACGLPLAGTVPHSRVLRGDLAHGVGPGDRRRSALVRSSSRLVRQLGVERPA